MSSKGVEVKGKGSNNQNVLATEILLAASPEFFRNSDSSINEDKTYKWILENHNWLQQKFGENYIFSKVHL